MAATGGDDYLIRVGLDISAVERGVENIKSLMGTAANSIASELNAAFERGQVNSANIAAALPALTSGVAETLAANPNATQEQIRTDVRPAVSQSVSETFPGYSPQRITAIVDQIFKQAEGLNAAVSQGREATDKFFAELQRLAQKTAEAAGFGGAEYGRGPVRYDILTSPSTGTLSPDVASIPASAGSAASLEALAARESASRTATEQTTQVTAAEQQVDAALTEFTAAINEAVPKLRNTKNFDGRINELVAKLEPEFQKFGASLEAAHLAGDDSAGLYNRLRTAIAEQIAASNVVSEQDRLTAAAQASLVSTAPRFGADFLAAQAGSLVGIEHKTGFQETPDLNFAARQEASVQAAREAEGLTEAQRAQAVVLEQQTRIEQEILALDSEIRAAAAERLDAQKSLDLLQSGGKASTEQIIDAQERTRVATDREADAQQRRATFVNEVTTAYTEVASEQLGLQQTAVKLDTAIVTAREQEARLAQQRVAREQALLDTGAGSTAAFNVAAAGSGEAQGALDAAQERLAVSEKALQDARAAENAQRVAAEQITESQAGIVTAYKGILSSEEKRAILAREFNVRQEEIYQELTTRLRTATGSTDLGAVRDTLGPTLEKVARQDIEVFQANLTELTQAAARVKDVFVEAGASSDQIAIEMAKTAPLIKEAQLQVTNSYAALSRALLVTAADEESGRRLGSEGPQSVRTFGAIGGTSPDRLGELDRLAKYYAEQEVDTASQSVFLSRGRKVSLEELNQADRDLVLASRAEADARAEAVALTSTGSKEARAAALANSGIAVGGQAAVIPESVGRVPETNRDLGLVEGTSIDQDAVRRTAREDELDKQLGGTISAHQREENAAAILEAEERAAAERLTFLGREGGSIPGDPNPGRRGFITQVEPDPDAARRAAAIAERRDTAAARQAELTEAANARAAAATKNVVAEDPKASQVIEEKRLAAEGVAAADQEAATVAKEGTATRRVTEETVAASGKALAESQERLAAATASSGAALTGSAIGPVNQFSTTGRVREQDAAQDARNAALQRARAAYERLDEEVRPENFPNFRGLPTNQIIQKYVEWDQLLRSQNTATAAGIKETEQIRLRALAIAERDQAYGPGGGPTGARQEAENEAALAAREAVHAAEDKVVRERAISEALLSQLQSQEVITSEGKTYGQLLGETALNQKLIVAAKQTELANAFLAATDVAVANKTQAPAEVLSGASAAKAQQEALIAEENAGNEELIGANAQITAARKAQAAQEEAAVISSEKYVESQATLIVAQQKYKVALDEAVVALGGDSILGGGGGGGKPPRGPLGFLGGFGQRFQSPDGQNDPSGALGGSIANLARFTIPFTLAFAAFSQIKVAIKDAEDLEKTLAITKIQFDSLGEGTQFEQFRTGILQIARDTGNTASVVAQVATQLQAAFGGNTTRALTETAAAMETVKISGLSADQVVNDFTAIIKSFGEGSTSIEKLSDSAVGLQQRFGVLVKDTIEFTGAIAPIASETGFTAKQIEALGAAYQEFSGRAGSAGAEQLGRVLSGIQDKAVQLVTFLQQNAPDIAGPIAQSLASGNIEQVFETLLANFDKLGQAQQQQLLLTIGGRRETATLTSIFKDNANVLSELQGRFDDSGKSAQVFAAVQQTLSQKIAELGSKFRDLGVSLYDAGLGAFLKDFVGLVDGLVTGVGHLVSAFQTLNEATHGVLGELTFILVALKAIQQIAETRLLTNLVAGFGGSALGVGTEAGGVTAAEGLGIGSLAAKASPVAALRAGSNAFKVASSGVEGLDVAAGSAEASGALAGQGIFASLATGVGAAAAAAPLLFGTAAFLAGKTLIDNISQGVQDSIQKGISSDLGGKPSPTNEFDVNAILGGSNISLSSTITGAKEGDNAVLSGDEKSKRQQLLDKFGTSQIDTQKQLIDLIASNDQARDSLNQSVHDGASTYQKVIDNIDIPLLGGPGSEDIQDKQKRIKEALNSVDKQVAGNLQSIMADKAQFAAFVAELRKNGAFSGSDAEINQQIEGLLTALAAATDSNGNVDSSKLSGAQASGFAKLAQAFSTGGAADKANTTVAANLKAQTDAAEQQQLDVEAAGSAKQLYQQGLISYGQYVAQLDKTITALSALASSPANADKLGKALAEKASALSNRLAAQADQSLSYNDLSGADPAQSVTILTGLLNNPDFTDSAKRSEYTKKLIEALKQEKDLQVSLATNAEDRARLLATPIELPDVARITLTEDALKTSSDEFATFSAGFKDLSQGVADQITYETAVFIQNGAKTVREAEIDAATVVLNSLEATYQQLRDAFLGVGVSGPISQAEDPQLAQIGKDIDQTKNDIAALAGRQSNEAPPAVPGTIQSPDITQNQANTAAVTEARADAKRLRDAKRKLALALAGGDPVATAQAAQQAADDALFDAQNDPALTDTARAAAEIEAQAQRVTADKQLASAQFTEIKNYRDATRAFWAALAGGDPVKQAQIAQQAADSALADAQNDPSLSDAQRVAATIQAQAQRITADRQAADAIRSIQKAQSDLVIAYANAAGDTVAAAQEAAKEAALQLAQAQADTAAGHGPGDAALANLEAAAVTTAAAAREAALQDKESHEKFLLDTGKITKQQYVAFLQTLLADPTLIKKDREDIERQIYSLKQQLGQDFKFNLPSVLGLPTLYEARRADQTPGGAGGYNDNRVTTVNVYANTNANPDQIASAVANVVGDPKRFATVGRRY